MVRYLPGGYWFHLEPRTIPLKMWGKLGLCGNSLIVFDKEFVDVAVHCKSTRALGMVGGIVTVEFYS